MSKKLIDLHWEWMEAKEIPNAGLCITLVLYKYYNTLCCFRPNRAEIKELKAKKIASTYWGYDKIEEVEGSIKFEKEKHQYTTLRQTIVLLICAMHDEL